MPEDRLSLDGTDVTILDLLQSDSAMANAELASRIGLSASACLSRTKRLREGGYIRQYAAIVDEKQVGLGVTTFTFVTLSPHDRKAADSFVRRIQDTAEVMECHHVTGRADYLLRIVAKDITSYRDFIMDSLVQIPEVEHVETLVVLKTEKRSFRLPIPGNGRRTK